MTRVGRVSTHALHSLLLFAPWRFAASFVAVFVRLVHYFFVVISLQLAHVLIIVRSLAQSSLQSVM